MSKSIFKNQIVHTVINEKAIARKAEHTKRIAAFAAKVQAVVMTADEPWDAAAKAALRLPTSAQTLFREMLAHIEDVYAPAREREEADTVWPEAWAGEWDCDDPETIWDQRWRAARRQRLEDFRAVFAQLLPIWVTECLKKPLY